MPSSCSFELNKPQAIYFSGETISGTIILNTSNNKNVKDVSIIFLGEGKVKWDESTTTNNSDGSTSTHTTYYRSHEVYVNNYTCVYGEGVLPPGQHIYTFSIPLPLECPTSLEGKYGHIRYEIILKIHRYYRFDNIYKKPVTVIKTIDLNFNSAYKLPLAAESIKYLCCWPCSSGKIFYTLMVPFGAYAPGQKLKYALDIRNQSMTDIDGYFIEFSKKIIFTAKSPRHKVRRSKDVLFSATILENCLRLTNRVIEREMTIPSTPPSTYRYDIICVEYNLKVVLHLSSCSPNPDLSVPIIIGTIPIRETLTDYQFLANSSQPQVGTNTAVDNSLIEDLPPSYNEIKPPTFEEATCISSSFIDTDIDARNRIVDFRPLYPIY